MDDLRNRLNNTGFNSMLQQKAEASQRADESEQREIDMVNALVFITKQLSQIISILNEINEKVH